MRRLSFFALALALALAGIQLVAGPETFSATLLRDGVILWLAAALLFGLNAGPWHGTAPWRRIAAPPHMGRLLLLTGAVVAVVGGVIAGFGLPGAAGLTVHLIWLLGVVLLLVGAGWPGGVVEYAAPVVRWEKDRRGDFVQVAARDSGAVQIPQRWRTVFLWLLVIVAAGALLRLWNLAELPVGCVANECVDGLNLMQGQALLASGPDQLNLFEQITHLWFAFTGNGVLSLRLTAALFGILALPAIFGLAWRLAGLPSALLTTAVLALSPWPIWASRSADPWTLTLCLVAAALWLTLQGFAHANVRWWTLAGLGAGLLFVETPPLRLAVGSWIVALTALALLPSQRARDSGAASGCRLLRWQPRVLGSWQVYATGHCSNQPPGRLERKPCHLDRCAAAPRCWIGGSHARGGPAEWIDPRPGAGGIGRTGRHSRRLPAAATLLGLTPVSVCQRIDRPRAGCAGKCTPCHLAFPARECGGGPAADPCSPDRQLGAARAPGLSCRRSRPDPRDRTGRSTLAFVNQLDGVQGAAGGQTETDMARFIARWLADQPDDQTTFIVPAGVAKHPSLRLLAGPATAAGRVQPLAVARTLPFTSQPPGDLLYLVPMAENQTLELAAPTLSGKRGWL